MSESKKLIRGNARKKNYRNKNNNKNLTSGKKTKINKINKINKNVMQKGGKSEYFEVKSLDDIDFDKISLTKHADVDWGGSAFGLMVPPTDCCIC